ncbi:MAG: amidase, partial [Bryobacteraceae bacterium]
MNRRTFFGLTAAAAGLAACKTSPSETPAASFELEEVGIAELAAGLRSGRWTSRKLAELYLARIEAMNLIGSVWFYIH